VSAGFGPKSIASAMESPRRDDEKKSDSLMRNKVGSRYEFGSSVLSHVDESVRRLTLEQFGEVDVDCFLHRRSTSNKVKVVQGHSALR